MNKNFLFLFILLVINSIETFSADIYWLGSATVANQNWNTASSWSGGVVPGAADNAIFDGGSISNCTLNVAVSALSLQLRAGFTRSVEHQGNSITLGSTTTSGSFSQVAGTFNGGSGTIAITGLYSLTGGSFKSTSGVLSATGNFTVSGASAFTHNNGTVTLNGSAAQLLTMNPANVTYTLNHLQLSGAAATVTLGAPLTLSGDLTIGTGKTLSVSASAYQISLAGNWNLSGAFSTGTGRVLFNGTTGQTISGATTFYNLEVNNSSSAGIILNGAVTIGNNLTFTQGIIYSRNGTTLNPLRFGTAASVTAASATSFVSGPVRKNGNTPFIFPVGKGVYLPIQIEGFTAGAANYEAEAFNTAPPSSSVYDAATLTGLGSCNQYWSLSLLTGTSSVNVDLMYNGSSCPSLPSNSVVTVAKFSGTQWQDAGISSLYNIAPYRYVNSNLIALGTSPTNFTFGIPVSPTVENTTVYGILRKKLDGGCYAVSGNILNFKFVEEYYTNAASLTSKVYNDLNQEQTSVPPLSNPRYGDNRFQLDVSSLTTGVYYILEVSNVKGEKWYLRFKK